MYAILKVVPFAIGFVGLHVYDHEEIPPFANNQLAAPKFRLGQVYLGVKR